MDPEELQRLIEAERSAQQNRSIEDLIAAERRAQGSHAEPPPPDDRRSRGAAAWDGFSQGVLLGTADEIRAAGDALFRGEDYNTALEGHRAEIAQSREDRPGWTIAPEVIGGAVTLGAPTARVGQGLGLLGRMAAGGAMGAAEGGVLGFNHGEGGAQERAASAARGAGIGAAIGGVVPGVAAAAGGVLRPAANVAATTLGLNRQGRYNQVVGALMRRAGIDADEVQRRLDASAADGQPEYLNVDAIGNAAQRQLAGVARQPGDFRQTLVESLDQRQTDQSDRIARYLSDALGGDQTADQARTNLRGAREAAASADYAAARADGGPVNLNDTVQVIDDLLGDDPIIGDSGLRRSELGRRLEGLRGQMRAGDGEQLVDFNRVLRLRSDLRATMENNPRQAPVLRRLYDALDQALEASSPSYRQANDNYAAASRRIDAVEQGQQADRPSRRATDVASVFNSLPPDAQAPFRTGYADSLMGRVENSAPGVNAARPLMSTRQQTNLGTMAEDPARLQRQIERENTMFETRRAATGGSQTADNLADAQDVSMEDLGILANLASGRWGAAGSQIVQRANSLATGQDEAVREQIARALLSRDTSSLTPAILQVQRREAQRRVAEALARSGSLRLGEMATR